MSIEGRFQETLAVVEEEAAAAAAEEVNPVEEEAYCLLEIEKDENLRS
jgi:hypothetical protein